jgi:hypothetical protein
MPNGVHNGNLTVGDRRNAIVEGIAHGQSVASICRRLHVSPSVVVAIRSVEWEKVENRKSVLAAQTERIATLAADRLTQELESNRPISPNALVPIYGVAIDKMLALRGDASQTVRHLHSIDLDDNDLIAFAVQRSEKRVKATVIEPTRPQPDTRIEKALTDYDQGKALDALPEPEALPCPIAPAKPRASKRRRAVDGQSTESAKDSQSTVHR